MYPLGRGHVDTNPMGDGVSTVTPPPQQAPGVCGLLYERLMQTNMLGALAPLRLRDPCPTASAGPTVQLFAGPLSHRLFGAVAPLPLRDCCPRCGTVAPLFALRALLFDVVLRVVVRSYDLYM